MAVNSAAAFRGSGRATARGMIFAVAMMLSPWFSNSIRYTDSWCCR
jgi:hypothetical protein